MTYLEWTSDIELGHAEIDEQHKRLLCLVKDLFETPIDPAAHEPSESQLQALLDLAQEHFAFEEGLMRSTRFPGVHEHVNFHTALLAQLGSFIARMQGAMHADPDAVINYLWHWMTLHIRSEDQDLVIWLRSHVPDRGR